MLYIGIMSEYASTRTNLELVRSEPIQDPLFYLDTDQPYALSDEQLDESEPSSDAELQPTTVYPRTVESWKNDLESGERAYQKAIEAHFDREDTPYEEHGGGLRTKLHELIVPVAHPLEPIIKGYRSYQWEVATAINQFGIAELTPQLIDEMSKRDRTLLARHYEQYLAVLRSRPRVLYSFAGEVHTHPTLYRQYGDTPPQELVSYAGTLVALRSYLHDSGITERLLRVAHEQKGSEQTRKKYVDDDRRANGVIHVVFNETSTGQRRVSATHEPRPVDQQ